MLYLACIIYLLFLVLLIVIIISSFFFNFYVCIFLLFLSFACPRGSLLLWQHVNVFRNDNTSN